MDLVPIIPCPFCRSHLHIADAPVGSAIVCSRCGKAMHVAPTLAALDDEPEIEYPVLPAPSRRPAEPDLQEFPRLPSRRPAKRRRGFNPLWLVYVAMYVGMAFLGYRLYERLSEPATPVVAKAEKPSAPPRRRHRRRTPARVVQRPEPEPVAATPPPAPVQPALPSLPAAIDLPPILERNVVSLFPLTDGAVVSLLSNTEGLRVEGLKVRLGDATVGGLRTKDGQLEFLWTDSADENAAAAVRNSVLVLSSGETKRLVRLRTPQRLKADKYDLSRSVFRMTCDVVDPPDPSRVRFDFTGSLQILSPQRTEGDDPTCLAMRQAVLLIYGVDVNIATKATIRKSGKLAVAELVTQFTLPSGDVEVVTVSRGNEKMNKLERLIADADDAPRIAAGLRSEAGVLRQQLRTAHVATVPIINTRLGRISNDLDELSGIVASRPALEADLRELQSIAEYSRRLRDTRLPYRFFMDVGGEQVDLVIAE